MYNVIGFKIRKDSMRIDLVIEFAAKIKDTRRRRTNSELNDGGGTV
jgi:hypothetical protein